MQKKSKLASRAKPFFHEPLHQRLTIAYGLFWLALGMFPKHRFDWFLEQMMVLLAIYIIARIYRHVALSNFSWIMVFSFLCLHAIGSHWTYAETPIGFWMADWFDWERNHYDRLVHFLFGLMGYWPWREVMAHGLKTKAPDYMTVVVIIAWSSFYEIVEWVAAIIVEPSAANAFLGSQGDVFDAHKDTLLAIIGAAIAYSIVRIWPKWSPKWPGPLK